MQNSSANNLHIVCFDVPFPPDYGGAMDMYFRIRSLHSLGMKLILHVFEYGRGRSKELENLGEVHYYQRKLSLGYLFSFRPFIVQSRANQTLLNRLLHDDAPILFEGVHTTILLEDERIRKRFTMIRAHNVEHTYYRSLFHETKGWKRWFFYLESKKLYHYEKKMRLASVVLPVKEADAGYFKAFQMNCQVLPASLPEFSFSGLEIRTYALFHGNLSVSENIAAVHWLAQTLMPAISIDFPLIIAGKNPDDSILRLVNGKEIQLKANPSEEEMSVLIEQASIHVLHTKNNNGTKLKLLAALSAPGHVLVNSETVTGIDNQGFFYIEDTEKAYLERFQELINITPKKDLQEKRLGWLQKTFSADQGAKCILKLIREVSQGPNS
jgi:hypothetical protein